MESAQNKQNQPLSYSQILSQYQTLEYLHKIGDFFFGQQDKKIDHFFYKKKIITRLTSIDINS